MRQGKRKSAKMTYESRQTARYAARMQNTACKRSGSPVRHKAKKTSYWSLWRMRFVPCWTVVKVS